MKALLQNIFSIKNERIKNRYKIYKVITVLGIKLKFLNNKKTQENIFSTFKDELNNLRRLSFEQKKLINNLIAKQTKLLNLQSSPVIYDNSKWERQYIDRFISDLKELDYLESYKNLISNLDEDSINMVNSILGRIQKIQNGSFDIFTNEEKCKLRQLSQSFRNNVLKINDNCFAYNKYLLPINHFEACVFKDRHCIDSLNTDYFKDKDIIDAGGYIADSAIIFSEYTSKNVYTFEPVKENYRLVLETIKLNNKPNIIPNNIGLGDEDKETTINYANSASGVIFAPYNTIGQETIKLVTLDSYVQEHSLETGLIKADLEGFEQSFLIGAKNTIKTQKPTLLISIYHTASDFFNVKKMIEDWDLGYKFRIVKPVDGKILLETLLIAEVDTK